MMRGETATLGLLPARPRVRPADVCGRVVPQRACLGASLTPKWVTSLTLASIEMVPNDVTRTTSFIYCKYHLSTSGDHVCNKQIRCNKQCLMLACFVHQWLFSFAGPVHPHSSNDKLTFQGKRCDPRSCCFTPCRWLFIPRSSSRVCRGWIHRFVIFMQSMSLLMLLQWAISLLLLYFVMLPSRFMPMHSMYS